MKRLTLIITLGLAAALSGNAAQACLIDPPTTPDISDVSCNFFTDGNAHEWEVDYTGPTLTITEIISSMAPDDILISGKAKADSVLTVVKKITNDTGAAWTQYTVTMAAMVAPAFVEGSAAAADGKLQTVEHPHPAALVFSGNDPVLHGETLELQFDVQIPKCGPFKIAMTQHPVPEPATIALLSLGSLALCRRNR